MQSDTFITDDNKQCYIVVCNTKFACPYIVAYCDSDHSAKILLNKCNKWDRNERKKQFDIPGSEADTAKFDIHSYHMRRISKPQELEPKEK